MTAGVLVVVQKAGERTEYFKWTCCLTNARHIFNCPSKLESLQLTIECNFDAHWLHITYSCQTQHRHKDGNFDISNFKNKQYPLHLTGACCQWRIQGWCLRCTCTTLLSLWWVHQSVICSDWDKDCSNLMQNIKISAPSAQNWMLGIGFSKHELPKFNKS